MILPPSEHTGLSHPTFGATHLTPHLGGGNHPPHPKRHISHLSQLPNSSTLPSSEAEPAPANTTACKIGSKVSRLFLRARVWTYHQALLSTASAAAIGSVLPTQNSHRPKWAVCLQKSRQWAGAGVWRLQRQPRLVRAPWNCHTHTCLRVYIWQIHTVKCIYVVHIIPVFVLLFLWFPTIKQGP